VTSGISVTAALIVRDEAEFIEDCLRSLVGNVDEIVLVDTGSRDDTIEIASRYPISLHHFAWCNDFSAARNFALDRASGEWILYIDADERLDIPDRSTYSQLLTDGRTAAWTLQLHPRIGWTAYSEMRLFRNDPRIRFQGAIHENLWPSINAVARVDGLTIGSCDVKLYHVGYEADQRPKNPRNIPLLRDALARDPDHFFCWWHLGECLRLAGDEDEAAEAWSAGIKRLRSLEPERLRLSHGLLYLALLKLKASRGEPVDDLTAEALKLFPTNLALQWMSARLAVERGDIASARPVLQRLAAIDGDVFFEPELAYDKAIFGHLSVELMALCEFRRGRFADAARLYRVASQTSPAPAACEIKARLAQLRAAD
jgi:tetratricopeptide (TPR) repeat protein